MDGLDIGMNYLVLAPPIPTSVFTQSPRVFRKRLKSRPVESTAPYVAATWHSVCRRSGAEAARFSAPRS